MRRKNSNLCEKRLYVNVPIQKLVLKVILHSAFFIGKLLGSGLPLLLHLVNKLEMLPEGLVVILQQMSLHSLLFQEQCGVAGLVLRQLLLTEYLLVA